jgi:hypothetical protein
VSPAWNYLAWRSLPVVLVLAWFLLLIGGFSIGGLIHLMLLAAIGVFGYQVMGGGSTGVRT